MDDIWKDIDGYEGLYQVNNLGVVRSLQRRVKSKRHGTFLTVNGRIMKNRITVSGYFYSRLCKDCIHLNIYTHKIIAKAFIPNPENKPQVNHINGIKADNRIENLEWCTPKENVDHAFDTGLAPAGHRHHKSKITPTDLAQIKNMLSNGVCQTTIAHQFMVCKQTITNIKKKYTYHRGLLILFFVMSILSSSAQSQDNLYCAPIQKIRELVAVAQRVQGLEREIQALDSVVTRMTKIITADSVIKRTKDMLIEATAKERDSYKGLYEAQVVLTKIETKEKRRWKWRTAGIGILGVGLLILTN